MALQSNPSFSVILPTKNRPEWTAAAVESVVSQRFRDFELIVVDDGSEGHPYTRNPRSDDRITVIQQNSFGPAIARNVGAKLARGRYLCFIDSDDIWHPAKLQMEHDLLVRDPTIDWWFCDSAHQLRRPSEAWSGRKPLQPSKYGKCDLPMRPCVVRPEVIMTAGTPPGSSVGVKREPFWACGGFHEDLRQGEVMYLVLLLSLKSFRFVFLDRVLVQTSVHSGMTSMDTDERLKGTIECLSFLGKHGDDSFRRFVRPILSRIKAIHAARQLLKNLDRCSNIFRNSEL